MIVDSHCHLDFEPMSLDLDSYVARAKLEGIELMLTISTENKSFDKIIKIVDKYENVYGTYGIHPHESKLNQEIKCEQILNRVNNKKIIGIGETGLDFFYNHSEKNIQIKSFLEHIEASQKANLPIIVHTRSAEQETFKILYEAKKYKDLKILIHCFTGSYEFAKKLLDLGAYISASGVVTFKKSKDLSETFKQIPSQSILVETDSPYLAPEPYRGKSNEPSFIVHTVKYLAKIKNMSYEKFASITTTNFYNLFKKIK